MPGGEAFDTWRDATDEEKARLMIDKRLKELYAEAAGYPATPIAVLKQRLINDRDA
jgi:putative component of toxin-antitoxin plasmid stabilization module